MTRKEYMETLKEKLSFMAEDSKQEILNYYAEMLDDRMEDGQSEEAAVAAMETPAEIAARVRTEQGETDMKAPLELGDEAMRFSSMVDSVLDSAQKAIDEDEKEKAEKAEKTEKQEKELDDAAFEKAEPNVDVGGIVDTVLDSVFSALGEAGKAVNQMADKFNEKAAAHSAQIEKSAEYAQEKSESFVDAAKSWAEEQSFGDYEKKVLVCPADQLRAVQLSAGDMPIRVLGSDGGEAVLTYYTCDSDPYEAEVQDGKLILRRLEKYRGPARFMVTMLGGMVRLWNKSCPTVELTLPRSALIDLSAHTTNASIKAEGLSALCDVEIKSSNGRIELKDIVCKSLSSATSNARQTLENVRSKQGFRASSSNGRIEGRGLRGGNDLVLVTSNGRIVLEDSQAHGEISLTTSNDSLEIRRSDAAAVALRTSNSSIRGTLPGPQSAWAIQSATSNGHNSLPRAQEGQKPLNVRTSNGSIDLHFD